MSEINEVTAMANEVINDSIVSSFSAFQDMLVNVGTFKLDNLQLNISNDIGTVTIPLQTQTMIDAVLKDIENFTDVNILYFYKTLDGDIHKLIAYSAPYHDEMYIISINSIQYGIVEDMDVTFFESLDVMFAWLNNCLHNMLEKQQKLDVIQQQSMTELYKFFL